MALYKLKVPSISSIRPSDLPTFRPPPLAKHTRVHARCSFVVHHHKVHTKYHLEKQHHHCSGGALAKHTRVHTRGFLLVVHDSWWFWCAPNGPPQMSLVHNFDPPRLGVTRKGVGTRHTYDHCWCILLMYTSVATALSYSFFFLAKYTSITPTNHPGWKTSWQDLV